MKKIKKIIWGLVVFVFLCIILSSFSFGYKRGYNKEFYSARVVEGTYDNKIIIKVKIYSRTWKEQVLKTTVCSKKNKHKVLRQLRRECKMLVKAGELAREIKEQSSDPNKKINDKLINIPKYKQI